MAVYDGERFRGFDGGVEGIPCLEEVLCEKGLRDGSIVYLDALADGAEMRRGIETNLSERSWILWRIVTRACAGLQMLAED